METKILNNDYFTSPIKEFTMTVPVDYDHERNFNDFLCHMHAKRYRAIFDGSPMHHVYLAKATNPIEPGATYKVEIATLKKIGEVEAYLEWFKEKKFLLTGAQGLIAVSSLCQNQLLPGAYFSLDEKENHYLWNNQKQILTTVLQGTPEDIDWLFQLNTFYRGFIIGDNMIGLNKI